MDQRQILGASVTDLRALLDGGAVSTRELIEATLAGIEAAADLRAFTRVLGERARAEADERDRQRAAGAELGPLHGIPVAVKAEIDVAGVVTSFGTRANRTPAAADAEVVRRLRAAGAIVVGVTAMPEFGQWPFTESSTFGMTRNPWERGHGTGGSSGGSAAAVAAGLVPVALGGDGGGSIRIPAACCGLFGLKPQRGRLSTAPHPHLWWALGVVGPLTATVLDSAIVHDAIRGTTATDRFTAPEPIMSFTEAVRRRDRVLRIGYSVVSPVPAVRPDPENVRAVRETAALLAELGHTVEEIDPDYPDPSAAFFPQFFGGVRAEAESVEDPGALERRTRQVLRMGAWARSAVVEWGIRRGEAVAAKVDRLFADHDLLLTPTIAPRPPALGVLDGAGAVRALLAAAPMVAYTALWNVTGHPAASVPAGLGADGLPSAVQLIGPADGETVILSVAAQLEAARPPVRAYDAG
ncbi:amidase [Nocardia takedensis]